MGWCIPIIYMSGSIIPILYETPPNGHSYIICMTDGVVLHIIYMTDGVVLHIISDDGWGGASYIL